MEAGKLLKPDVEPFQLSLRIRHPSLDPDEVSREFGIVPEHSFRAGEPRPSRSGLAPASVHPESYWLGALNPAASPFRQGFRADPSLQLIRERLRVTGTAIQALGWALALATRFLSTHAQTLRRIGSEGGQVSLLVNVSSDEVSSFQVTPEVSRVLSELGIAVEFEFARE